MFGVILSYLLGWNKKKKSTKKVKSKKLRKNLTKKKTSKKTSSSSSSSSTSTGDTSTTTSDTTTSDTSTTTSDTSTSNTQQKVDNTEENEKLARAKFSEGLRDLMSFEIEFQGFIPQLHTNMFIWFELPEKHVLANYSKMVAGIDKTTTRGGEYVLNRYYVEKVTRSFDEGSMVTKVTLNPFASNLSSYYKLYTDAIKAYDQANCSSDSSSTSSTTSETITVTGKPSTKQASKYYEYKDVTKTWKNLCMSTSCKGQNPGTLQDNPKGVYEHEITCSKCDSDYDVTTGADKSGSYRFYLQDANGKSNTKDSVDTSIGGGSDGSVSGATSSTGASSANCVNSSSSSVYNGNVSTDVATAAKQITSATGIQAAQDLANWNSAHIIWEGPSGFYQSPSTSLKRKRANCCCKTELLLDMCNVMGVSGLVYVHVSAGAGRGHVFAKIQGTIVDPTKKSNPWGNWVHGYGNLPGVQTNYPKKPFAQTY